MASSQEESEQPKLCLPTLVLRRICTFLCDHCEPQQPQDGTQSDAAIRQSKMTLKNLCQVSKTMRLIAEPILYHYWKGQFDPESPSAKKFIRSSIRFLSTLHAHPHLRPYVKALDIRDCARDEYSRDLYTFDFDDQLEDPVVIGRNASTLKRIAASAGIKCARFHFSGLKFAETIVQIMLLLMLPRLNKLTLIAVRSWEFDLFHLEIDIEDAWFNRRAEKLLIRATASHLKSLICTSGPLKEGFDMPQLDSLRVDIRHAWPNAEAFLDKMTCLRRLSFQSSCPESSSLALNSSTTIEELSVRFGREAWKPDAFDRYQFDEEEQIDFCLLQLDYFVHLKWLSVDVEAIISIENLEDEVGTDEDIDNFVYSLPDSLEILHIGMNYERGDPDYIFESILDSSSVRGFKGMKAILWSSEEFGSNDKFRIATIETNLDSQAQWSAVREVSKKQLGQRKIDFFPDWERLLTNDGKK
ncbi:unnamed protein product [Clonostachys rosea]|uniref:F-box domain-containing protein n=1 Tax=Bionectria ochroleuca TaxID=29856 RepID=A0ABY6UZ91_BIOOC|nr:unnamed protein product [Clonostachys rosea]